MKVGRPPYPREERTCEHCGNRFLFSTSPATRRKSNGRHCGQLCHLRAINTPERQARISRESAGSRALKMRDRATSADGKLRSYRKVNNGHEHIQVMEKKLGRKMLPGEIVHHEDENKRNNEPDNLVVMTRAEHGRHHARLRREAKHAKS